MLMKSFKLFVTVLALSISTVLFAQNKTVTGTVKDAASGEGVVGATVQVKGTATGVVTNVDGAYSINVPANGVLVFSCIGYETVEKAVNGAAKVDVALSVDAYALEGTVKFGYGSAKKVGNLVGSVTTVKSDIVKNAPSSSALDQLQGQVAGMLVLTSDGMVGTNNVSITIHGTGSLGASSTPLYVIDGVPSSTRTMNSINPNDIESVSVLKDATATSIYGARAANGVVYITTKGGSFNSKATVTVRSQWGVSTLANEQFYQNLMSGDELKDFWIQTGLYTPTQIKNNYTNNGFTSNTQWYKYYMNLETLQSQNDVTIEGGSDKVAYSISASQFHQDGSAKGNFLDRYTARVNVQAHPKTWLTVGTNAGVSWTETRGNGYWATNNLNGGLSYMANPLYPAIDPETGEEYEVYYPNGRINPTTAAKNNGTVSDRYFLNANAFVQIEPIRNLKFRSQAGTDTYFVISAGSMNPSWTPAGGSGSRSRSAEMVSSNSITNTAEYSFSIADDHDFSVLVGQEGIFDFDDYFSASASGQTDDRILTLGAGTQATRGVSESYSGSKFLSYFGHADYSYQGKYIIDGTLRNDACSRFGVNNRNATFWAAGAKWNIKKEDFMKNVSAVNNLSAKISYGTQGNAAIGDYQSLGLISSSYTYGGASSVHLAQPSNPDLTWEKQGLFTVSLDGRLFNLVDFELSYYDRRTSSMLMDVPYPYTSGFSELTANVGALSNKGLDITLGVDVLRTRDAYFRVSTVFNYNKETVEELFQGRQTWIIANTGVGYNVGSPVMYYYPIYAGIDPEDGQQMWYVPGEDTNVTTMDPNNTTKVFDEDALTQNTGIARHAPINGGLSFQGGYKGLSFAADFSYVYGKYIINNDRFFYENPAYFAGYNTSKSVADYWTPENKNAKYPDWSTGASKEFDTDILEDASFIRLKNLQVGYSLPTQKWGWKTVKGIKFTATGRNLLTFTKYTGLDPEVNSNIAMGRVGNSKQFLGGVEITF